MWIAIIVGDDERGSEYLTFERDEQAVRARAAEFTRAHPWMRVDVVYVPIEKGM